MDLLSRTCVSLEVSHLYRPPRPVTGIDLHAYPMEQSVDQKLVVVQLVKEFPDLYYWGHKNTPQLSSVA
jgi:hypothetical protein